MKKIFKLFAMLIFLVNAKHNSYAECFRINDIEIDSKISIKDRLKNIVLSKYNSKCIDYDVISLIVRDLVNLSAKEGYFSVNAYLPEQDLTSGILKIKLTVPVVEEVLYQDSESNLRNYGLSNIPGKFLNLRDIEQELENLNALRSNNAKIDILPADEVNKSKLIIKNQKERDLYLNVNFDNLGTKQNGTYMNSVSLTKENLFSLNDSLSITEKHNIHRRNESIYNNYNAFFVVPYNLYKFAFNFEYGIHKESMHANNQPVIYSGWHRKGGINLTKSIIRNKLNKLDVSLGIRKSKYIEKLNSGTENILKHQSPKLSIIESSINLVKRFGRLSFSTKFKLDKGIKHDSSKNDYSIENYPKSDFVKFTYFAGMNYLAYVKPDYLSVYLTSSYKIENSPHNLYSVEKFDLGAADAVRGLTSTKSDNGYAVRNEIIFEPNTSSHILKKTIGRIQIFTGLDFGGFKRNDYSDIKHGFAKSYSLGIRTLGGITNSSLTYSKVISSSFTLHNQKSNEIAFSIGLEV